MIRHLVKLVWRRKRQNGLLVLEMCGAFLVLAVVLVLGVRTLDNARRPIGFDWHGVLSISVESRSESERARMRARMDELVREVRQVPGVVAAANAFVAPYQDSHWTTDYSAGGRLVDTTANTVSETFADVLRVRVARGRWFRAEDRALNWTPVVLNASLARELFGSEDPVGRRMPRQEDAKEQRVVGIVDEFRQDGEFASPGNYVFVFGGMDTGLPGADNTLLVRTAPGAGLATEQALVARLRAVAPEWSFIARSMEEQRAASRRERLAALGAGALVGGFLVLMVALGLIGVLWQNVTRRTREIGLRRAMGATGRGVRAQILAELMLMTTVGVLPGLVVLLQLPLLHWTGAFGVGAGTISLGLAAAAALMYVIAALCGAYPAWLVTRIDPAVALRYE